MEELDLCPKCGADLHYEAETLSGQMQIFSRLIGVEIRGVYDGVLYWLCPDCDIAFQRWDENTNMNRQAQPHIDQHNLTILKREG